MQFYDFKEVQERVILIGVQTAQDEDVEASLDELEELAQTAGAETAAKVIQNREAVHPGTYIGKGKIEEVRNLLRAFDANGVICDDELSPAQMNNLEKSWSARLWTGLCSFWIFLPAGRSQARERSRWSWRSLNTGRPAWWDSVIHCPGWEAGSAPEGPAKRNWRQTED